MRVVVLGTGMIGSVVVRELARSAAISEVVAVDAASASVERCVGQADHPKVSGKVAMLDQYDRLVEALQGADIAVGCLPHALSTLAIKAAIAAGCHLIFRLESLLGLCTKPALAVENGELVKLPPLSRMERLQFPEPVGECEAVVTDAHSTAYTLKSKVTRLYEKTVRYKGHWDKMNVLAELGFLDETPIEVDGALVSPQKLAVRLLERQMKGGSNEDITVLRVTVSGTRNGERKKLEWEMVDHYDNERKMTSMAKTTGFPAILIAEWMAEGKLEKRGVAAIEDVIIGRHFDPFLQELGKRGITISFKEETA